MARFTGTLDDTFETPADIETCKAHLVNHDAIRRSYPGLDRTEPVDDETMRLILEERNQMGHSFVGAYTCRWERTENGVRWRTIGDDNNMWISADLTMTPHDGGTRIHWHQTLELEIPVGRVAAKMLSPVVSRLMARGLREYADNMLAELDG